MRINQQIAENTRTPAQLWGNVLIPLNGTITVEEWLWRLQIALEMIQNYGR